MSPEETYYAHLPLQAALIRLAFPDLTVTGHDGYPEMFPVFREDGSKAFAWGFRDKERVQEFVHAEYQGTNMARLERVLKNFQTSVRHKLRDSSPNQ